MKYPFLIVIACLAIIVAANIGKDKTGADKEAVYRPIQHSAPANLLDYPPQNGENHGDGLYSQIISPATNNIPLRGHDIVHVEYKLWNSKGENVDASDRRYHLMKLRVDGGGQTSSVIEGWKRIIPYLKEGETRRVWIPEALAYAKSSQERLKGTLVFDITIAKVDRPILIPEFDTYPTEPNEETLKLPSGLAALKTKSSKSAVSPKSDNKVEIHLNLWKPDGTLVRSTEKLNRQLQIALDDTIPGMAEAVSLMKVGERYRFWMPASLTYGDSPPANFPASSVICDIELLAISPEVKDVSSHRLEMRELDQSK